MTLLNLFHLIHPSIHKCDRRVHGCVLHLDIKDGKIWVQHNATELPIAQELVALGVPKEDIILGFQAPYASEYTGLAYRNLSV